MHPSSLKKPAKERLSPMLIRMNERKIKKLLLKNRLSKTNSRTRKRSQTSNWRKNYQLSIVIVSSTCINVFRRKHFQRKKRKVRSICFLSCTQIYIIINGSRSKNSIGKNTREVWVKMRCHSRSHLRSVRIRLRSRCSVPKTTSGAVVVCRRISHSVTSLIRGVCSSRSSLPLKRRLVQCTSAAASSQSRRLSATVWPASSWCKNRSWLRALSILVMMHMSSSLSHKLHKLNQMPMKESREAPEKACETISNNVIF